VTALTHAANGQGRPTVAPLTVAQYEAAATASNVRAFDAAAVVNGGHGFTDVNHYYDEASPYSIANRISCPTLSLNTEDDPVCALEGLSWASSCGLGEGLAMVTVGSGGHSMLHPQRGGKALTEQLVAQWFSACNNQHNR
jgi:predicted alpha/beta-fold hydrolase